MVQAQIFVSHSQKDAEIRRHFNEIFSQTGVISKCMEFEKMNSPDWKEIRGAIHNSGAVFLLLGPNVRGSIFTQNWIAFEVGAACAYNKDVWVFEQNGSDIGFPIPYVTDYLQYAMFDNKHFQYVKQVIEVYRENFNSLLKVKELPRNTRFACPHCHNTYWVHQIADSFTCPYCCKSNIGIL